MRLHYDDITAAMIYGSAQGDIPGHGNPSSYYPATTGLCGDPTEMVDSGLGFSWPAADPCVCGTDRGRPGDGRMGGCLTTLSMIYTTL